MLANRALHWIIMPLAFLMIPVQVVTTLVLGVLISLPLGFLLLLPLSLIWMLLLGPLLGVSWVGARFPRCRTLLGLLFLPWVVVAYEFSALVPSMGEHRSRVTKLLLCDAWPFSWAFWLYSLGRLDENSDEACRLRAVLHKNVLFDQYQMAHVDA